MNLITNEQVTRLRRAQEIHEHLTKLVLEGTSIQAITETLASLVKNPVIVEDGRFNVLAVSVPDQSLGIDANPETEKQAVQSLLHERLSPTFQERLLHSDYYKRILRGRSNDVLELSLGGGKARSVTIPILTSSVVYGFISMLAVSGKYSSMDMVALEQGATTVALQLVKDIMNEETQRAETDRVIESLIRGRIHTSSLKKLLPANLDWATPRVAVCIEIHFDKSDNGLYVAESPQRLFENLLRRELEATFGTCIMGWYDSLLTVLVPFRPENVKQVPADLEAVLKEALAGLKKKLSLPEIRVAIGGAYPSPNKLQKSYDDALQVLKVLNIVPSLGNIVSYERIAIYRIISMIRDHEELHSFSRDLIEPLLKHDQEHNDALCETLYAYLLHGGNVTATSRQLYVHPNTVSYRIKKIQHLLGDVLNQPEHRLALAFALIAYQYTRVSHDA